MGHNEQTAGACITGGSCLFCYSWLVVNIRALLGYVKPLKSKILHTLKGKFPQNNNVDWVSRKQFYKPNSKILSKFG